nr:alkaline phosphatase D family protein [Aestuariibacter sp. A3R04]
MSLATAGLPVVALAQTNNPLVYRNAIEFGPAAGSVTQHSAIVWCRASRAGVLAVEVSETESFHKFVTATGSHGHANNDFNCKATLTSLDPGTQYYYRCHMRDSETGAQISGRVSGQFRTANTDTTDLRFCWSGDTAGQGFGIDPAHGGMKTYQTMLQYQPDFLVHCGDQIYADNPILPQSEAADGSVWQNRHTDYVDHVAQTTQDFRNRFYYNYFDPHFAAFHQNVASYYLWDDHEVRNNWYPGQTIEDQRYTTKDANTLAQRARTAMVECNPLPDAAHRQLFQHVPRGPLLDLFFVDMRSYRTANRTPSQTNDDVPESILGAQQLDWLKTSLLNAKGVWKIIALDMPIGVVVADFHNGTIEGVANTDGPASGREAEIAELLSFIKEHDIQNVHFITADVHYCASHYYSPEKAQFKHFKPFWEFVSGPLHAGTFGPNRLDNTFGPELVFKGIPDDMPPNQSPAAGFQFFGVMSIDAQNKHLTVSHVNRTGDVLWSQALTPEGA